MDRINSSTQRATNSIGKASGAVDTVNTRFTAAEGATSRLTQKVTRLAAAFLSFETVKKGMEISDTYTNINSKLSLITQNARQLKSLQNDIFAAADRARGTYTSMADTVAKLGIIAGKQFGGNQNIVKFTETMQKMFKIGGTPVANQAGAMLQLQQAIGLGRLQGQDLRILAEDAPLVETAIAKYMGKSVGDVRQLGTQGKITSQVLINSILQYSGTVDQQMGKMSYTWGDYWNKIKNGAMRAFSGTFGNESKLLGSQNFQNMINGIISSFYALADVANRIMTGIANIGGFVAQNWSIIAPIVGTVTAAVLLYNGALLAHNVIQGIANVIDGIGEIQQYKEATALLAHADASLIATSSTYALGIAAAQATVAQGGFNMALLACPITWIIGAIVVAIGAIYLVIAIVDKATHQAISATGVIVGAVFVAASAVWNIAIGVINGLIQLVWTVFAEPFLGIVEWVLNVANGGFNSFGAAVANLIGQIIGWFLSLGKVVTKIIDAILGTNWTAGLESLKGAVTAWGKNDKAITLDRKAPTIGKRWDEKSAWKTGHKFGQGIDSKVKGWKDKLGNLGKMPSTPKLPTTPTLHKNLGTSSNPATVKGTGADGTMKVNITDQDLQYMRDLAEKQYINKFSTAVLSPKLNVSFSGNVGDKNDQKQIYSTISRMLKEELATAAEGYYPV